MLIKWICEVFTVDWIVRWTDKLSYIIADHCIDIVYIRYRNGICGCSILPFFLCGTSGGESIFSQPTEKAASAGPGWKGDRCSGERAGAQQTAQRSSAGERDSPSVNAHLHCWTIKHCFFLDAKHMYGVRLVVRFVVVTGPGIDTMSQVHSLSLLSVMTHR